MRGVLPALLFLTLYHHSNLSVVDCCADRAVTTYTLRPAYRLSLSWPTTTLALSLILTTLLITAARLLLVRRLSGPILNSKFQCRSLTSTIPSLFHLRGWLRTTRSSCLLRLISTRLFFNHLPTMSLTFNPSPQSFAPLFHRGTSLRIRGLPTPSPMTLNFT